MPGRAQRRQHHAHVVSAHLVRQYRCLVVEDLAVKNMTRSAAGSADVPDGDVKQKVGTQSRLPRPGGSSFIQKPAYKGENVGGRVIVVKSLARNLILRASKEGKLPVLCNGEPARPPCRESSVMAVAA